MTQTETESIGSPSVSGYYSREAPPKKSVGSAIARFWTPSAKMEGGKTGGMLSRSSHSPDDMST